MGPEKIIAQLPEMPPERVKNLWFSAMRIATSGKGDVAGAERMLEQIEAIERSRERPAPTEQVGALRFEPHGHGFLSFGYDGHVCVAAIQRLEQHRGSGNRVYRVEVLGQALPDFCRSIDEARSAAAHAYAKRDV